ncbi:hypothetical protein VHEMI06165 [[Torrubiella] hemipterigena]|uniref:Uncharacterized protein n=1 Tax=[Torrubiella] hemipterigena TaxID=1531966 RepID=A0A0A1TKG5_9HYPO|nr:hypothetical protein VHEMI06165 [[Torrubiella] hemipterigena]
MIRRNSNKKKTSRPLGRSKSMNCVTNNNQLRKAAIDRDAHIAAALSYRQDDARCLQQTDSESCRLVRSQSFSRGSNTTSPHAAKNSLAERSLRRQQSVRFAGPRACPRKAIAPRANKQLRAIKKENIQHLAGSDMSERSFASSGYLYQPSIATTETRSQQGATKQGSHLKARTELASPGAKRLRKSQSMVASRQNAMVRGQGDSYNRLEEWLQPDRDLSLFRARQQANDFAARHLHNTKSLSHLKTMSAFSSAYTSDSRTEHFDSPLQLSRDLRGGVSHNKLSSQGLSLSRSKHQRAKSATELPRSLRNSSNDTDFVSSTLSLATTTNGKSTGFRYTARKVSRSVKTKLRSFFSRPKERPVVSLNSGTESGFSPGIYDDEPTYVSRVKSHLPSLHSISTERRPYSRRGSLESIESELRHIEGDKSRVTSWTNSSTCAEDIAQDHVPDRIKSRLSVINESVFNLNSSSPPQADPRVTHSIRSPTDNQQVYSALIQRLDEMNKLRRESESNSTGAHDENGSLKSWKCQTIRCVEKDDVFQDSTGHNMHSLQRRSTTDLQGNITTELSEGNDEHARDFPCERPVSRVLSSRSSAFFGSPSNHLFRTQSPYRRALQQSMKMQQTDVTNTGAKYLSTLSTLVLPLRRASPSNSEKDTRLSTTDSVYSRQSAAVHTKWEETPATPQRENKLDGDSVKEFVTPPLQPINRMQNRREVSSASSVEWKTWLSANVSKLETPPACSRSPGRLFLGEFDVHGHIKEETEITEVNESPAETPSPAAVVGNRFCSIPPSDTPLRWSTTSTNTPKSYPIFTDENLDPNKITPSKIIEDNSEPFSTPQVGLRNVSSLPNVHGNSPLPRLSHCWSPKVTPGMSPNRNDKKWSTVRAARQNVSSVQSSPGLTAAIERQFGKARNSSQGSPTVKSPISAELVTTPKSRRSCLSELDAQAMGSRRMVDLFLSSRQNRVRRASESSSGSAAAAFV